MERNSRNQQPRECQFGKNCKQMLAGRCKHYHPPNSQLNYQKVNNQITNRYTDHHHANSNTSFKPTNQNNPGEMRFISSAKELEQDIQRLSLKQKLSFEDKCVIQNVFEKIDLENFELLTFYSIISILEKILESGRAEQSEFILVADQVGLFYSNILERFRDRLGHTRSLEKREETYKAAKAIDALLRFYSLMMHSIPSCSVKFNTEHLKGFAEYFSNECVKKFYPFCLTTTEKNEKAVLENLKVKAESFEKLKSALDAQYSQILPNNTKAEKKIDPNLKIRTGDVKIVEEEPKDDFRLMSLYPTNEDFDHYEGELRRNKSHEPFKNLQQYLDIHFRLLREDFYTSIRNGFIEFAKTNDRKQNQHLRFGKGKISSFVVTKKTTGINLVVNMPKSRNASFNSKRFIFGSMLLISNNNFRTYMVCIVKNIDEKDIEKTIKMGYINVQVEVVKTECSLDIQDIDLFDSNFEIVETKVYFEPYYQVLLGLQNSYELPLKELIVECKVELNTTPVYLSNSLGRFDNRGRPVIAINPEIDSFVEKWVTNPSNTFDPSQAKALRHVFKSKLSIIQGPPGTGKTYVGTHLVRIMLHLKERKMFTGPIFIICFTNHALDQFLEALTAYTDKITRLGGQTKSEVLKKYTLMAKRDNFGRQINKPRDYFRLIKDRDFNLKKFNELKQSYEKCWSYPFIVCKEIFNEMEYWFFEAILVDYRVAIKHVSTSMSRKGVAVLKAFEKYYEKRFQGMPELGLAVLYWLEILNFDTLVNEMAFEGMNTSKIVEEANFEEQINTLNAQKALDENKEEHKYQEGDDDLKQQISSQHNIAFMMSPPLENPAKKYKNNYEMFDSYRVKLVNRLSEGQAIYNSIFKTQAPISNQRDKKDSTWSALKPKRPNLSKDQKWILNTFFMNLKWDHLDAISEILVKIKRDGREIELLDSQHSRKIIENDDIIAMTTTGAAKYKNILKGINSKIVIVEEAAEVIESHITVSLTQTTEHLILIGDHMQLRPAVNDNILSNQYNFDISMFERLINNNLQSVRILDQRRMRPEISGIIRLLYPDLIDSKTVLGRPNIKRLSANVFFFNHLWREDELADRESKINKKEADFLCKFAELLIKIGYKQQQITILSLYAGQLLYIKKESLKNNLIKNIRVATVDNFQGEENDIILLSLVRSNTRNTIGFLKVINRVNVALSRAKLGLYMFGNAQCIRDSELKSYKDDISKSFWLKVLTYLNANNMIDDFIRLDCPRHKIEIHLKTVEDFQKCPNGGCKEICQTRLECGHSCPNFCHDFEITPQNQDGHAQFQCVKKCEKPHACGHSCGNLCSKCDIAKWKCPKVVDFTHPICKHTFKLQCHKTLDDPKTINCLENCNKTVQCGHKCQRRCFEECATLTPRQIEQGFVRSCEHAVDYETECRHIIKKPCGQKLDVFLKAFKCQQKCKGFLTCSHECVSKCYTCFEFKKTEGIELHDRCGQICKKILVCDHSCEDVCTDIKYCSPCVKKCQVRCLHSVCPKDCGEICAPCIEACIYQCPHVQCSLRCFEICDRPPCNEPCPITLKCSHPCLGFCGEKCPQVCRVCDPKHETFDIFFGTEDDVDSKFVELDCGHSFESVSLDYYFKSNSEDVSLKYIKCPKCRSQIRFCMRYQQHTKTVTSDIDKVKSKIMQDCSKLFKVIKTELVPVFEGYMENFAKYKDLIGYIRKWLDCVNKCKMQLNQIHDLQFCMNIVEPYLKLINRETVDGSVFKIMAASRAFRDKCLEMNSSEMNKQILQRSLETINLYASILDLYNVFQKLRKDYPYKYNEDPETVEALKLIENYLQIIEEADAFVPKKVFNEIQKFISNSKYKNMIAQKELMAIKEIAKAVGLHSGHWFTCVNGHPFAIGECGGAMEESRCPDCGAKIGGRNHTLAEGNRHAGFIDGSQRPHYDPHNFEANERLARQLQERDRL